MPSRLAYAPDQARFRRIDTNETGTTTTYYVAGGAYQVANLPSGQITRTAYLAANLACSPLARSDRHGDGDGIGHDGGRDALPLEGSPRLVRRMTDALGAVMKRFSFDAWGKRREFNWQPYLAGIGYIWQAHDAQGS